MRLTWRRAVAASAAANAAAVLWLGWAYPAADTPPAPSPLTVYFAAAEEAGQPAAATGGERMVTKTTVAMAAPERADLSSAAETRAASGPPAGERTPRPPEGTAAPSAAGYVPARVLERVEPAYPEAARRRGAAGRVRVRALVSAAGAVEECAVASSSGHADLDAAAVEAVRRWRFAPAAERTGGRAAASYVTVPVVFELR